MNKIPGLNSNVFFDPVGLPFSQVSSEVPFNYPNEVLTANNNWTARGDRATNFLFSSGDLVSQWNDLGSDNKDLTQGTTSLQPTLYGDYIESTLGGDSVKASSVGDWKFLSDGSDYTLVLSGKNNKSEPIGTAFLLTSNYFSGNGIAFHLSGGVLQFILYDSGVNTKTIAIAALNDNEVFSVSIKVGGGNIIYKVRKDSGLTGGSTANIVNGNNNSRAITLNLDDRYNYPKISNLAIFKELKSDTWVNNALNWLYNYYS